jgi:PAS domain S-box-containing protein
MRSAASRAVWPGWKGLPYLVLLLALLFAALATYHVASATVARDALRFQNIVARTQDSIQARLDTYLALLRASGGLFAAQESVSRTQFRSYVERLDLEQHYPGIQGLGFSLKLGPQHREGVVAQIRRQGEQSFRIWPEHERAEIHTIVYIEPPDERNRAALGYDMFTDPVRRAAMERARDTGLPAASAMVTLVQEIDPEKQPGFLIYAPVYRFGTAPRDETARRAALIGFVYGAFRMGDLLEGIFGRQSYRSVEFELFDGPQPLADNLLYRSERLAEDVWKSRPAFVATSYIPIAGHTWSLRFVPGAQFELASARGLTLQITLAGALAALLLFAVTRAQVRARATAEQAAALLQRSEAALRESDTRYRLATKATSDVIWDWDVTTGAVRWNENVRTLFGYPADEVGPDIGWRRTTLHPQDRGRVVQSIQSALEAGEQHWQAEYRFRCRDGRYVVVADRSYIERDPAGERIRVVGAMQDITARKQAEHERERLIDALARSNRELDQFAYVASHDLRAPLRGISNLAQWIEEDMAEQANEDVRGHLRLLRSRIVRMDTLIDGLLRYARAGRERDKPEPVDTRALLGEVVDLLGPPEGTRIELAADLPILQTERLPLQQIFLNLLGNAIKYGHAEGEPAEVRISAREDGAFHEFTVEDHGEGIPPEYHAKVFAIFQTLQPRDKVEGTGIGLALVKKLVESRGGRVSVQSESGKGATFRFTWPILPAG